MYYHSALRLGKCYYSILVLSFVQDLLCKLNPKHSPRILAKMLLILELTKLRALVSLGTICFLT